MTAQYILAENLISALALAIETQRQIEEPQGRRSIQRAGWEEVLKSLRAGEQVFIKHG